MPAVDDGEIIHPVHRVLSSPGYPHVAYRTPDVRRSITTQVDRRQASVLARGDGHSGKERPGLKSEVLPKFMPQSENPSHAKLVDHTGAESVSLSPAEVEKVVTMIRPVAKIRRASVAVEPRIAP